MNCDEQLQIEGKDSRFGDNVTHWLLPNDELLHFLHLGHMVFICFELPFPDPLINTNQHLTRDVFSVINTCQISRILGALYFNQVELKINPQYSYLFLIKHLSFALLQLKQLCLGILT